MPVAVVPGIKIKMLGGVGLGLSKHGQMQLSASQKNKRNTHLSLMYLRRPLQQQHT